MHFHGVNKGGILQRSSVKKTKDGCSKLNKEINKLRNAFRRTNLKNQVMFKYSQSVHQNSYIHDEDLFLNRDINEALNDPYISLGDLLNESDELILENDKDFKINTKLRPMRNQTSTNETKKYQLEDCVPENPDEELKTNVIRIDCTYVDKSARTDSIEPDENIDVNTNEIDKKPLDPTISELQSLLIMMTLSSKSNYDEGNDNYERDTIDEKSTLNEPLLENTKINKEFTECEDINEILNIKPILVEMRSYQKIRMKKYVEKWRKYVRKRQEVINQQRQIALSNFFNKLEKKKANVNQSLDSVNKAAALARDYSTYQHRYKVQRQIIALQKAKLEQQNRLIEELKYNKIIEASRQSVDTMREEVRKTYYEIDRQLKPKIKCLTNELKIPEIDESTLALQCLKVPQFLQRMEKRAREREEKHAMIRERRRQMEEERLRLKQQAELAKAEMDKDEKMKRIKELREKRKKEKIDAIRRKQFTERMRALIVMADLHYEKHLLMKFGMRPLKRLLKIKQDNIDKAISHYTFQLKKNVFLHLMWYTEDMVFERNFKAEEFYRKRVLYRAFACLKQNHHEYVLKKQVAEDYYDIYVIQLMFRKFREAIEIIKKENQVKWQAVVNYYNSNIMFKIFTSWRTLPALNALQREQEARKARWRLKVLQVVPDYTPPDN
ncbi:hypothetical protein O3G_MSEX011261 [Manduca sexta]|nr:hypothetical protein O3G_MSEX011261 [Manduca sexta]